MVLLSFIGFIQAQDLSYQIGIDHYFDNREVHTPYSDPQTLFGIRVSPELVWNKTDQNGSKHQVHLGVHYLQPIGAPITSGKWDPIVFYQFTKKKWNVNFGMIPYDQMIEKLPIHVISDSLSYFYPNINGFLIQYQPQNGFFEAMLDWRGAMSQTTREAFRVILKGRYYFNWLSIGGHTFLNHLANKAPTEPKEGVCDNYLVVSELGFHLSKNQILDTTSVKLSYLLGSTRERITQTTIPSQGVGVELFLKWRFVALQNIFYTGNNLMPLYEKYGSGLHLGDPYYRASRYNRSALILYLIEKDFVECTFSWNLHFTKGDPVGHQQLLNLKIHLDKLTFTN